MNSDKQRLLAKFILRTMHSLLARDAQVGIATTTKGDIELTLDVQGKYLGTTVIHNDVAEQMLTNPTSDLTTSVFSDMLKTIGADLRDVQAGEEAWKTAQNLFPEL